MSEKSFGGGPLDSLLDLRGLNILFMPDNICWLAKKVTDKNDERNIVETDRIETDRSFSFMEQKKPFNFKSYLRNRLEL